MTQVEAPAPPQGPGVVPPFPAPPTEGRGLRLGLSLGVGALILFLVCGGGIAAAAGLGTVMSRAVNEQAQVVVGEYLDDIRGRRYAEAYESLCGQAKQSESQAAFTSRVAAQEPLRDYDVGDVDLADVQLEVPVTVTYQDGRTGTLSARLGQNQQTGQFQVCSVG